MNLFDKLEAQRVAIEAKRVAKQQYTDRYNEAMHKQALERAKAHIQRVLNTATHEQVLMRCISKSYNFGYISTTDSEYVLDYSNYKENPFTPDVIAELKAIYRNDGVGLDVGVHDDWGCILVTVVVKW